MSKTATPRNLEFRVNMSKTAPSRNLELGLNGHYQEPPPDNPGSRVVKQAVSGGTSRKRGRPGAKPPLSGGTSR